MPKLLGQDRYCEVCGKGTCGGVALKKSHCESSSPTWLEAVVFLGMPEKAGSEFLRHKAQISIPVTLLPRCM